MTCGFIFDDDYRKKHEIKVHDGKRVKIKHLGVPDNPFKLALQNFEKAFDEPSHTMPSISEVDLNNDNNDDINSKRIKSFEKSELMLIDTISSIQINDGTFKNDFECEGIADLDEQISWISCAGQLENLINDFNLCTEIVDKMKNDTHPSPIIFLLESIQIISTIKTKAKKLLTISKKVSQKMSSIYHIPKLESTFNNIK